MNPDDIDPLQLGVLLSLLPPDHILVVAARLAVEAAYRRAGMWLDADYAPNSPWHRNHQVPASALQRARWGPTGDRANWVRWGDAGPPEQRERGAAA